MSFEEKAVIAELLKTPTNRYHVYEKTEGISGHATNAMSCRVHDLRRSLRTTLHFVFKVIYSTLSVKI
jgi:hypothetical protein